MPVVFSKRALPKNNYSVEKKKNSIFCEFFDIMFIFAA